MISSPTPFRVLLSDKERIAERITTLELRPLPGQRLPPFEAGAHVDLHLLPGVVRQYSLSNDPAEADRYRLAVLLEVPSRGGSTAVHHALRPGETLTIGTPRNNFRLLESANDTVLFAGGIGITPMLAMAYRLHRIAASFELHYCVRSLDHGAFIAELQAAPFAHAVHLHFDNGVADQKLAPDQFAAPAGLNSHAYICGPRGFIDFVTDGLALRGWSPAQIHVEHFRVEAHGRGQGFTVIAQRSCRTIIVDAQTSIADALHRSGLETGQSCGQGICGNCLVPVLSGTPEHRDLYQTAQEQAANTHIAVCCSRALSPTLVLDI